MTRIATSSIQQSALADIMRAQRELNVAQRQLTTGKRADDMKGYGTETETLTATRAVLARENAYIEAGKRLTAKLEVQSLAISEVSSVAADLRQALTEALGLGDGRTLMARMEDFVSRASAALNTKFGGDYLFGGGRDGAAPVTATSLADLAGGAAVSTYFQNGDVRSLARLDDGKPLETGVLADELGAGLMACLDRIKDFADGLGGDFSDPLTGAERAFLTTEIGNVAAAFDGIALVEAKNGIAQNAVDRASEAAASRKSSLEGLLSDLEDADMAGVATRIQQAQTALEASAQVFSMLSRSSLLDYLR